MSQLNLIQRTKIVELWHQAKAVMQVHRLYQIFFKTAALNRRTIIKTVVMLSTGPRKKPGQDRTGPDGCERKEYDAKVTEE